MVWPRHGGGEKARRRSGAAMALGDVACDRTTRLCLSAGPSSRSSLVLASHEFVVRPAAALGQDSLLDEYLPGRTAAVSTRRDVIQRDGSQ